MMVFTWPLAAQPDEVSFSHPGGFYLSPVTVTLSNHHPEHAIRYTLNGSVPTMESFEYTAPLPLDTSLYGHSDFFRIRVSYGDDFYYPDSVRRCIVIRAATFDAEGHRVSEVATNSYFINALGVDTHELPVLSICADSLSLFDFDTGIMVPGRYWDSSNAAWTGNYYQTGREWERLCNVEYYTPDNMGVNQQAGLRAHGHYTRTYPQKALRLYARAEYGRKYFDCPFFDELPLERYKRLVLHPFTFDAHSAGIQDGVCNSMAANLNVEALASRPVVVYLNGEYWGLYFLRERPDEHYLAQHTGADEEEFTIVEDWYGTVDEGDNSGFLDLMSWLSTTALSDTAAYSGLLERIDIESFIDYQLFELFIANDDWPANNMRCWRQGQGRWRWIFYDGDHALYNSDLDVFANATYDGPDFYPSSSQATLLFRRCLENEEFKARFVGRANALLATHFSYAATRPYLHSALQAVRHEIPNQVARFGIPYAADFWDYSTQQMDLFLRQRSAMLQQQLADYFNVTPDTHPLLYDVVAYPNPFRAQLSLSVRASVVGLAELKLYDLQGRCRYAQPLLLLEGDNNVKISPSLPPGTYILRLGDTTLRVVSR